MKAARKIFADRAPKEAIQQHTRGTTLACHETIKGPRERTPNAFQTIQEKLEQLLKKLQEKPDAGAGAA